MVSQEFKDRIFAALGQFCSDPSRGFACEQFKPDWARISDQDASDFVSALDAGLVEHKTRGNYGAPNSRATEHFFWSGKKAVSPRSLTLWAEPIITLAVIWRLHSRWGWPKECLGTQSKKWEFDVAAYRSPDQENEYIACEVKKSDKESDRLIEFMHRFSTGTVQGDAAKSSRAKNALRKLEGLRNRQAPIFWAVGPNETNKVFRVNYSDTGTAILESASEDALRYPGSQGS